MNPDEFDIDTMKMFGLWPHGNLVSRGIAPYLRRMPSEKITIALMGDYKCENVYDFQELLGNKIEAFHYYDTMHPDFATQFAANQKNVTLPFENRAFNSDVKGVDVFCLCSKNVTVDQLYFALVRVKEGGIIAGAFHDQEEVAKTLNIFRRQYKIGTPINISNQNIWFWFVERLKSYEQI